MCGIVGYLNGEINKEIIKAMTDRIKYRGPDAEGFYMDEKCALGHRRLSVIDLEHGNQPIYNEDKSIVIVYNGEIYNFKEVKEDLIKKGHDFSTNADTEVLVHGYEEYGYDLTHKLRGMFAFAIWDIKNKELFCAVDNFGIKPFYYYENNGVFMFASEIKAFLDHPAFNKELNDKILSAYLCMNSTPTTETFFKGVFRLQPGHRLIYKDNKIKIERYFKPEFIETNKDYNTLVSEIEEAMKNSIKYHSISDVEIGSFLSGGVDSSYIVTLAKPNKTYTVGYDNPKYDETSNSKDLAEKLHITNKSKKITKEEYLKAFPKITYYMDEPLADPSAIALYFASEMASKDVKVVFSGEGADELFGGYNIYKEEIDMSWYMKIPYFVRRALSSIVGVFPETRGLNFIYRRGKPEEYYIGIGRVFRDREARKMVRIKNQIHTKDIVKPIYKEYKACTNIIKRQVIDFYFWLVRDFLHAVDRNTMMFSLEARTPFLDKEVYNIARQLPIEAKINRNTTKVALRDAAKRTIPNESYKNKKLGFPVPLREWIREEDLYNEIKSKFESEIANKYFNKKRILKLLNQHKNNKKDNYKKIWGIYTFIVWYEIYFVNHQNIVKKM